ncbi:ferrichrome ABC transporter substrate-binding protein [Haloarcula taiwanensis]|uniref:Ferrichrome ABC transporter substrate-binding protein n=1 Tax=Haloarcula taiwanensis TaxID=1932004 RepID=A0A2H5A375_9EURY|nr:MULTISPECIES: ABC transporter substrate-binding protein [Haloarcula]AUG49163.1 ferrichrome ABC transporter substrate-binding protein [Haloarcula taiwanensis]RLM34525.1 ABC transporter substrate-binding protein [Haloarcula sp. Atlit-120R]RLM43941.1 ABC transporter substrate-binding protein [Haloarcula sp. Atlit-47R]RLM95156.1 ABC transporter substrate-binding protein [Haloarcula sp. Atlit-7R]
MSDNDTTTDARTRRDYLKYGGAVISGGLLAGCTGDADSQSTPESTDSDASTVTANPDATTPTAADSYTVSMEPMGEVQFDSAPERWMAYFSTYGDMAIALGQLEGLAGLIFTENWPMAFFDAIPNVDVTFDDIPQLMRDGSIGKEAFYEMDSDVHLFDPNFVRVLDDTWSDSDFTEVRTNIGPIVGNSIRRRNDDWHDYRYYSLYEAFDRIADAFQERERYAAFADLHDSLLTEINNGLPPENERPTVGLLSINSDFEGGSFYAYPVHDGNGHKQYRDLGMRGAFDEVIDGSYAEWDYEQLLDVDPDILLFQYGFSHVSTEEFEDRMATMREDPIGQQLSAVQNDRLYRGGTSYQGPIINLFQTEAAAKQFYPETFGEWHGLGTTSDQEQLFDRQRVAAIINGEI